jgi:hypothetical protein
MPCTAFLLYWANYTGFKKAVIKQKTPGAVFLNPAVAEPIPEPVEGVEAWLLSLSKQSTPLAALGEESVSRWLGSFANSR